MKGNGLGKGNGTVRRHRTLWISDVHLGSRGCKAKELVAFLQRNDCAQLYLVGDIFDGWKMKSNFYWTADHSRVVRAIISKARRGTKVHYLAGNHDSFMRQFVRRQLRLGKIKLGNEIVHTTADGRKLLVLHGDRFDAVINNFPLLAAAGDVAYELLMESNKWVNRVRGWANLPPASVSSFAKHKVKSAVQYLSGFDDAAYYECKRRGLNGVICGHSHHAEVRHIRNGIVSYNCGDWVESCTALTEDAQGRIELVEFKQPAPLREAQLRWPQPRPEPERLSRAARRKPAAAPPPPSPEPTPREEPMRLTA